MASFFSDGLGGVFVMGLAPLGCVDSLWRVLFGVVWRLLG